MKKILLATFIALSLPALVAAQDLTPVPPSSTSLVQVGHGNWPVTLPDDEPLVVWAGETIVTPAGQFAKASVFVQTSEGDWVQLTPCDNVAIICESVQMRIENVHQGQQFYLDGSGS